MRVISGHFRRLGVCSISITMLPVLSRQTPCNRRDLPSIVVQAGAAGRRDLTRPARVVAGDVELQIEPPVRRG